MAEDDATTKPTLDTIFEMLGNFKSDVTARLDSLQSDLSAIKSDLSAVKLEQTRQAKQLDSMAKDLHTFAADLYELRLEFPEFKEAMTVGTNQSLSARK